MEKAPEQGAFFVLCLLFGFDGGGIGAVAQAQNGGDDEQSLDAQCLPDPAAEQGDENGDHMIDGYTGGDGRFYLVDTVGQFLNIVIGGHGGQRDHCIQHIIDAADNECDFLGKQVMGKTM